MPFLLTPETQILLVDDLGTMRAIIKKILGQLGYNYISQADDGDTALPMLESGEFDLVISDWNMKRMQGIDLLKAIRSHPDLKDLPVMMVTAEIKRDQVQEAIKHGVNAYIAKPFTAMTLQNKLIEMAERLNKEK